MLNNTFFLMFLLTVSLLESTGLAQTDKSHIQAHAHNDYRHARPLQDALDHGFRSVEADIFLVEGELLVGHDRAELSPERTLRKLYLEPLKQHFEKRVIPTDQKSPPFMLLIDIKTDGESVYPVLRNQLQEFQEILCTYQNGTFKQNHVQVVISGDRPQALIAAADPRYVGIDGRLSDLDSQKPAHLMPLISDRWTSHFRYRGQGPLSKTERAKLKQIVKQAHASGRRIRFWATPETEATWRELLDANVDHINTDQLQKLDQFLSRQPTKQ